MSPTAKFWCCAGPFIPLGCLASNLLDFNFIESFALGTAFGLVGSCIGLIVVRNDLRLPWKDESWPLYQMYTDAVTGYGPGCATAVELRRQYAGNKLFIQYADEVDRLKLAAGGNVEKLDKSSKEDES